MSVTIKDIDASTFFMISNLFDISHKKGKNARFLIYKKRMYYSEICIFADFKKDKFFLVETIFNF